MRQWIKILYDLNMLLTACLFRMSTTKPQWFPNMVSFFLSIKLTVGFPVVMYRCEIWTIRNAERRRIEAFKLWCWRRRLRIPWTAKRSNQSILKEINPEYSLEGPMLQQKLQSFGHLLCRTDSLEKTLMLRKIEEEKRMTEDVMVGWHHWHYGHEFEQTLGDSEGQGSLECCSPRGRK